MQVRSFVFDSENTPPHVESSLDLIAKREEAVSRVDVAEDDLSGDVEREAMLTVKEGVRVGSVPDALFDENGQPDFSVGALVTVETTGRRSLHIGPNALQTLRED